MADKTQKLLIVNKRGHSFNKTLSFMTDTVTVQGVVGLCGSVTAVASLVSLGEGGNVRATGHQRHRLRLYDHNSESRS